MKKLKKIIVTLAMPAFAMILLMSNVNGCEPSRANPTTQTFEPLFGGEVSGMQCGWGWPGTNVVNNQAQLRVTTYQDGRSGSYWDRLLTSTSSQISCGANGCGVDADFPANEDFKIQLVYFERASLSCAVNGQCHYFSNISKDHKYPADFFATMVWQNWKLYIDKYESYTTCP